MKTPFKKQGISLGPLNWFVPMGNRTESKRDTDSVSESKRDTDDVIGDFFPARFSQGDFLFSMGDPLEEFSFPLYRGSNDRDFFLRGDDTELVTGAVTDASACEVFDRAYSLVS